MDRAGALTCACDAPPRDGDWLRIGLGLVVSGQLMVLSLASNLTSGVGDDARARIGAAMVGLTLLVVALLGPDLWRATRRGLERRDVGLEAMFLLALAGGAGASLWGLYAGGDVFFEVIAVVLTVHAVGARLKDRFWSAALARAGVREEERATLVRGGDLEEVPADTLVAGDRVAVFAGGRVPADGVVAAGSGWLDTSAADGSRLPALVAVGDAVPGGALLGRGALRVDLTHPPDESAQQRAFDALVAAWGEGSPSRALTRRVTRVFGPFVAIVAVTAGLAWAWHGGIAEGFRVATAVLLVACPCGFGVATPVALWATASALEARGVSVRRLRGLEALADVGAVVLDKTGTLAAVLPTPVWTALRPADLAQVRRWASAVEGWSDHPVAAALRGPSDASAHDVRELAGGGLAARVVDGDHEALLELRPGAGGRSVEVRVDGEPVARVALEERLVGDAAALVAGLRARGLAVEVHTGDAVAPALDAPCRTGGTPAAKADRVRALREERGAVAFVGDAANDLPALAAADVAIAVPGAAAAVLDLADLAVQRPADLLVALDAARALRKRLRALLGLSAAGNLVGIAVAAAGLLHPVLAAVIMTGSSLTVTLLASPGAPNEG